MYTELKKDQYKIVESFFSNGKYQIPALSVINLTFPGKIFVDDIHSPKIVLVWVLSRWSYINCSNFTKQCESFLKEIFENEIAPLLMAIGDSRFEIYTTNVEDWDVLLNDCLGKYSINKHYENTFSLDVEKYKSCIMQIDSFDDLTINEDYIPIIPAKYMNYVDKDFTEKTTFAITLKEDEEIITQCSNNGLIYENQYFIDLNTLATDKRCKGFGTLAAYELIKNQLDKELLPLWETTADNIPSEKVAHNLGFVNKETYPVYEIIL